MISIFPYFAPQAMTACWKVWLFLWTVNCVNFELWAGYYAVSGLGHLGQYHLLPRQTFSRQPLLLSTQGVNNPSHYNWSLTISQSGIIINCDPHLMIVNVRLIHEYPQFSHSLPHLHQEDHICSGKFRIKRIWYYIYFKLSVK